MPESGPTVLTSASHEREAARILTFVEPAKEVMASRGGRDEGAAAERKASF